MTRELLVYGEKIFRIKIPDDAKVTFGPWAPKGDDKYTNTDRGGTLRIYGTPRDNILACFTHVKSFRDLSGIEYSEQVVVEEGSSVWKSDRNGYERQEKVNTVRNWENDTVLLESGDELD